MRIWLPLKTYFEPGVGEEVTGPDFGAPLVFTYGPRVRIVQNLADGRIESRYAAVDIDEREPNLSKIKGMVAPSLRDRALVALTDDVKRADNYLFIDPADARARVRGLVGEERVMQAEEDILTDALELAVQHGLPADEAERILDEEVVAKRTISARR